MLAFFLLLTHWAQAQPSGQPDSTLLHEMDSVEISLLSCRPRQYIYSLYGHTAIRITDHARGTDYAVNYGLFSFSKPFFILRFVFGLTDYEMGIARYDQFRAEYRHDGCGVRQQVLNLTRADKLAILQAIDNNYRPENITYRYNFFYDNCTTRARDIIIGNIQGKVNYHHAAMPVSYRDMIHAYTQGHPWARFGNDLLLGVAADRPTTSAQQQFLPFNLSGDFGRATVTDAAGHTRPLTVRTFWAIAPAPQQAGGSALPALVTPRVCAAILAVIILGLCIYDARRRCLSWGIDLVLMVLCGLCGLILLAMVFSQHPTVRVNLQILLLNPLALFLAWPAVRHIRRRQAGICLTIWPVFLVLFLFGALWQNYADGMCILASSLLVRTIFIHYTVRKERSPRPADTGKQA